LLLEKNLQLMLSTSLEDKEEVEVFLVDSGRTVHVDVERVLPLPEELQQESNQIKHLAFLFHLKVINYLAD
jgi:Tudor domain